MSGAETPRPRPDDPRGQARTTGGLAAALGFSALALGIACIVLRLFAELAFRIASPFAPDPAAPLAVGGSMELLVVFPLFFGPALYLGLCFLARRRLPLDPGPLVGAAGVTFLCAVAAEIGVDHAFVAVGGEPAWRYVVWPVQGGYTSGIGVVMWPLYGGFVHLLHGILRGDPRFTRVSGPVARGLLVAAEAMFLEIAANLFTLVVFGRFLFYYLPGDLLHFTTFRIAPPYAAAGLRGVLLLDRIEGRSWAPALGAASWGMAALALWALG